jgi:primosomal protein N' (replication factor Y)
MCYAEVSVNSPIAQRRTFSYSIPEGLNVKAGQAVWVPFGDKTLQGVILDLTDYAEVEETRDIISTIDPLPLLSPAHILLSRWISNYYLSPLFDAVALMLPPGFERRTLTCISLTGREYDPTTLTQQQRYILQLLDQQNSIGLRQLEKALGKKNAQTVVSQLIGRGLVIRSYKLERDRIGPKQVPYLRLTVTPDEARQARRSMKRVIRQAALLEFLTERQVPVPLFEVRQQLNTNRAVIDALQKKGLLILEQIEVRRHPFIPQGTAPSHPLHLIPAQETAFRTIRSSLSAPIRTCPEVFLLHGVTGSGKTEVYLQALAETVRRGKRSIVLVPEIALTPQTIERFAARFPNRVAVLHSRLSLGEQYDEWQAIRNGEFDVVIGPRSALFAPQPDLGLIVIDEEHEWTYKQQEQSPRYHTRDTAIKLAELTGATVVLGSATPDVETFHRAQRDDYVLLSLPERVTPGGGTSLPRIEIIDLREELKTGNRSIFSVTLSEAIERVLDNGEQAILFLNRRGGATSIQCRNCGLVLRCRRCEAPLSYHLTEDILVCHQCNQRAQVPRTCPRCMSRRIKFLGLGTQRLERETSLAFPSARLLRWDSDVTRRKQSHQEILDRFRNYEADILIGTQMVAKGLDLPRVTLVGVVNADIGLNLPDFRAGERTFQLLCQVAGRAGRGTIPGRVIIQTYAPEHYAVQAAAGHDYDVFYETEITYRRQLRNPPFTQLARLTYTNTNDAACWREAKHMERCILEERDARGIADLNLIGPAPAFIHRLRGRFRWQILLRGSELSDFLAQITVPQGWTVDIDPVGL